MRVKLTVQYCGKNYGGWQVQPNRTSVQQVLQDAVKELTGESVKVIGSGRTDAGVHARRQTAHFDVKSGSVPAEKFCPAMNVILPDDVKILESEAAEKGFDARKSAKSKTYCYRMYRSRTEKPLYEPFMTRINTNADAQKMREAAKTITGTHDFRCFTASGSSVKDTVRTVYALEVEEEGDGVISVRVTGNGFLYNMVRIIAGTLLLAGYGKILPVQIESALIYGDRSAVGRTLPAKGLCLENVIYG